MIKGRVPKLRDLTADVWVSERHKRELEVTSNPVEYGAPITDHAYLKPRSLSVSFGVTNTPLIENDSFGGKDRVTDAREKLFKMQDDKELLEVETVTGGLYKDCLITSIGWSTDSKSPNSVIFEIELREILITKTRITEYQPLPADERTSDKASTTKKRGEVSKRSREEANEKRSNTADASTNAEELAKSAAANAQADKIAGSDNKTLLKKLMDFI